MTLHEPAERATTPSAALFTRISSRNRQFERRRRASVKNKLFEQIRDTRNDAEHVTLYEPVERATTPNSAFSRGFRASCKTGTRSGSCETDDLRNEHRHRVEHLCVGFSRKRAIRANSRVKRFAARETTPSGAFHVEFSRKRLYPATALSL